MIAYTHVNLISAQTQEIESLRAQAAEIKDGMAYRNSLVGRLEAERDELKRQCDEYKADAERYRWLCEMGNANSKKSSKAIGYTDATRLKVSFTFAYFVTDIDATIDTARITTKGES